MAIAFLHITMDQPLFKNCEEGIH